MSEPTTPGVYVEEIVARSPSIEGSPTSMAGFVGVGPTGPREPHAVTSAEEFARIYGSSGSRLADAVRGFFGNGGTKLWISTAPNEKPAAIAGALAALARIEEIGLVAAPGVASAAGALVRHAEAHRRFAFVDAAESSTVPELVALRARLHSSSAAIHHPWIEMDGGRHVPPSGPVAGIYARTDLARGIWKAPAGELVEGAVRAQDIADTPGINRIRALPGQGIVLWGARTTSDDPDWKYVPVRRTMAFFERSIEQGTAWAVFEPNDEPLWDKLRSAIENFLRVQWRAGALLGAKEEEAFFIRCDRTTMTQADIDAGRLLCLLGCALVRPAEFVVLRIACKAAPRAGS